MEDIEKKVKDITVAIELETLEKLDQEAFKRSIAISPLIREILMDYLNKHWDEKFVITPEKQMYLARTGSRYVKVRLTLRQYNLLKAYATKNNIPMAHVIKIAVAEALDMLPRDE
ncbi:MAG: hypothetical protein QXV58_15145 [Saccharolobus sp.]|uniref:hypothetical protein n=1 Tax=Saccharolobus sp. TaxID=2100761 RepID=UPI003165FB1E